MAPALWRFHPGFRWRWPIRWILNIATIATVSPVIGKVVWFTPGRSLPAPFDSVAMSTLRSSGEVWVVLYEHGHATGLVEHIEFVLRPYQYELIEIPRGEHPERLYRITGLTLETGTQ